MKPDAVRELYDPEPTSDDGQTDQCHEEPEASGQSYRAADVRLGRLDPKQVGGSDGSDESARGEHGEQADQVGE